ncbi:uncharacterized protein V6R79_014375 [Siganus canaliculatus]
MCSAADPSTRHHSALLYQIGATSSTLAGVFWTLSAAPCSVVILIVLLDAGLLIERSQDSTYEPKTLGPTNKRLILLLENETSPMIYESLTALRRQLEELVFSRQLRQEFSRSIGE